MDLERKIFTVLGVLPEPGGYGVAKFSRSSKPYQQWIMDLTEEDAQKFYKTFYFDYGHESIADLAHVTVVMENISLLAGEDILDESLMDAQASSTRYQDYSQRKFITPPEIAGTEVQLLYEEHCDKLINEYLELTEKALDYYVKKHGGTKPADMPDDKFRRTLKARALDVSRYLLPVSARTGMGIICSARTLERHVSRLLSSDLKEIREIAEEIKLAAIEKPAFNPTVERLRRVIGDLPKDLGKQIDQIKSITNFDAKALPTMLRYGHPSEYQNKTYEEFYQLAKDRIKTEEFPNRREATLYDSVSPDQELLESLLYKVTPFDLASIREMLKQFTSAEIEGFVGLAYKHRGKHDRLLRESKRSQYIFEVSFDFGTFKDLHRHRNAIQIIKPFTALHGFDTPDVLSEMGYSEQYQAAMARSERVYWSLHEVNPKVAAYALPQAYRRRALFKMDDWETQYITELRSASASHFSIRELVWKIYEQYKAVAPARAKEFRVTKPEEENFFKR